jgi:DNA polymerase elongation subunit (family B)
MSSDLKFHILDIIARDQRILNEDEEVKEVCYDSDDTDGSTWSLEEFGRKKKKAQKAVNGNEEMIIHLFGKTAAGHNVRADVTGFKPFFFLRLPNKHNKVLYMNVLRDYIKSHNISTDIFEVTYEERKLFIGYTEDTLIPFARITTKSISAFRKIKNLFLDQESKPAIKFNKKLNGFTEPPQVFEANLDPMLRFFHLREVDPCGWVSVKDQEEISAPMEFECDWEDISPTTAPISAPFLVASWDIECYSATGDFPLAKKDYTKTAKELALSAKSEENAKELLMSAFTSKPRTGITQITPKGKITFETICARIKLLDLSAFIGHNDSKDKELFAALGSILNKQLNDKIPLKGDPVIQIGVVLWSQGSIPERHIFCFPSCAPVSDATVHSFKDERSMILGWGKWMTEVDPDILLGYNIFGFDERYVWDRCKELAICNDGGICQEEELEGLNRLYSLGGQLKLEEKFLSSSALGDNYLFMFTVQGRLQIDLYQYIRRTAVLDSYKLDNVAKVYMSGKLESVKHLDGFRYECKVKTGVSDARIGRSIVLLDETGEAVSDKMVIKECLENSQIIVEGDVEDDWADAVKWVIVKDDVSPQEIFKLHRGDDKDRARLAAYCIQDCELVVDLYKKLEVFNTAMSMANVCTVPVSYIMTRGQGIKIESLIFRETYKRNQTIIVLPAPNQNRKNADKYEGAIVLDPIMGLHEAPVGVADFASLYPSTMISENISHDKIIWAKDYDLYGNFTGFSWGSEDYDNPDKIPSTDIEFDILKGDPGDTSKNPKKVKVGVRVCRYAQDSMGTVPQILQMLLAARKAKRNEGAKEKDPLRAALLDAEQNAYKITANSLYGQLGSPTFKIRLQHLAASVTGYGRKQILFAKKIIETFYGGSADARCDVRCEAKTVYGDSVTGDTPLLVRFDGNRVLYVEIKQLMNMFNDKIINWHDDKEAVTNLTNVEVWTEKGWTQIKKTIRHKLAANKKLFRIVTGGGYVDVTEDHSLILSNGVEIKPTEVQIGTELLHSIPKCNIMNPYIENDNKSKLSEAYEWFSLLQKDELKEIDNRIKGIIELDHPGEDVYVYDLETDNHHFGVGPGALIVHNTDSLFVQFNPRNPETGEPLKGREARIATIELTAEAGELVTQALKAPHDFEFDKVFDPILLFSKKRYAGKMFENDQKPDDYVYKYMGISLKRRDNAPILKTIYGTAMKKVLEEKDVAAAYKIVRQGCLDLVEGRIPMTQLMITKSLRAEYANPNSIAHKALANRIAERDPGNAPSAGDRIGYVYIKPQVGKEVSKLQGDRIETPQFIKENGLHPDYAYYIEHQISKPVGEMFAILLEQIPGFDRKMFPSNYNDLDEDQQFSIRDKLAYELLFRDILDHSKKMSESMAKKQFMNMFGWTGGSKTGEVKNEFVKLGSIDKLTTKKTLIKSQEKQMSIDTWFAADILLKESRKERKKAANAANAANEKEKENNEAATSADKDKKDGSFKNIFTNK